LDDGYADDQAVDGAHEGDDLLIQNPLSMEGPKEASL
jgi:hypothetical protein